MYQQKHSGLQWLESAFVPFAAYPVESSRVVYFDQVEYSSVSEELILAEYSFSTVC